LLIKYQSIFILKKINKKAFFLIEIVFSILIISIVLNGFISTFTQINTLNTNEINEEALDELQTLMELEINNVYQNKNVVLENKQGVIHLQNHLNNKTYIYTLRVKNQNINILNNEELTKVLNDVELINIEVSLRDSLSGQVVVFNTFSLK
jgi:type II secretory pathway pseudopilin PulG